MIEGLVFIYSIGKYSYRIKSAAQLRARNKSCAAETFVRESARSTLLF